MNSRLSSKVLSLSHLKLEEANSTTYHVGGEERKQRIQQRAWEEMRRYRRGALIVRAPSLFLSRAVHCEHNRLHALD